MKEIPLTQGLAALVDDADYEWLSQWKWCVQVSASKLYAARHKNRKCIMMHRVIMQAETGQVVDHLNRNGLHNYRENLRITDQSHNVQNADTKTNNTSGYTGVSWSKSRNKWHASIKVNYTNIHLGYYKCVEEAARAYDKRARELFGTCARLNFPVGQ